VTTKTVANAKVLTKETTAQLKAKQLQTAIDKANLALSKGGNIFDMDAIQLNAALINQAEQLGKATNAAQVLAITNDLARLKVKQDILALEAAIASGDEAAITAATNKLNADMKILSALQSQSVKLLDIKSILESLVPKDLINLANLQSALDLLTRINLASTGSKTVSPAKAAPSTSVLTPATTIADTNANVASLGGLISSIGSNLIETTLPPMVQTILQPNGREFSSSFSPNIVIQANTIANPDELTNIIQDTIIRLNKRGDYLTTAGSL
jgi:hypothetical protein